MTLPNPRRENVSDGAAQIIFQSPGLQPDVWLKFFDVAEFHVHSVILKLYSAFFRKLLDSPDKAIVQKSPATGFQYEWIMVLDKDGDWHPVSASGSAAEKVS
jgi:hypothetical protein